MSYFTTYEITLDGASNVPAIIATLEQVSGYSFTSRIVNRDGRVVQTIIPAHNEDLTWYKNMEDIKEVSSRFKGVLFTMRGNGEDPHDMWITFAKNGLSYQAAPALIYPTYDPKLLET